MKAICPHCGNTIGFNVTVVKDMSLLHNEGIVYFIADEFRQDEFDCWHGPTSNLDKMFSVRGRTEKSFIFKAKNEMSKKLFQWNTIKNIWEKL